MMMMMMERLHDIGRMTCMDAWGPFHLVSRMRWTYRLISWTNFIDTISETQMQIEKSYKHLVMTHEQGGEDHSQLIKKYKIIQSLLTWNREMQIACHLVSSAYANGKIHGKTTQLAGINLFAFIGKILKLGKACLQLFFFIIVRWTGLAVLRSI